MKPEGNQQTATQGGLPLINANYLLSSWNGFWEAQLKKLWNVQYTYDIGQLWPLAEHIFCGKSTDATLEHCWVRPFAVARTRAMKVVFVSAKPDMAIRKVHPCHLEKNQKWYFDGELMKTDYSDSCLDYNPNTGDASRPRDVEKSLVRHAIHRHRLIDRKRDRCAGMSLNRIAGRYSRRKNKYIYNIYICIHIYIYIHIRYCR